MPVCYVYVPDVSTNISILILVSIEDAVVQGIRTIAIDPNVMMQIKEACFHQLSKFSSKEECEEAAEKILDKYRPSFAGHAQAVIMFSTQRVLADFSHKSL